MVHEYQLFINGIFVPSTAKETFESINPYNQEIVGRFARGKSEDIDKAVAAARKAFDEGPWSRMSPDERAQHIHLLADIIGEKTATLLPLEVINSGSTLKKAQSDLWLCVNHLKYFARLAAGRFEKNIEELSKAGVSKNFIIKEPVGVCGQIIPWNFPLLMAVWKIGPALASGCTIVLKPAEETPLTAMVLAQMVEEAGFPPGVVNIVTGYGEEAGAPLVSHPGVDKIAFTGSTETGRKVMAEAAATMKKVTLECGGKSANIILDDADYSIAIDGSLYAAFYHSGQCCIAGSRLLIPESRKDIIIEQLIERAKRIHLGNPMDKNTNMGPLISKKQLESVLGYIEKGKDEGAKLLIGGNTPSGPGLDKGFFVEPTIFVDVDNKMTIAQEEIFGPVLSVITYKTEEDAIKIANNTQYGLAGAVWSRDTNRAMRVARQLRAGTVWINEYLVLSEKAPFGGYKQSGLGREMGPDCLDAYMETKHIHVDELASREKKFWYDSLLQPADLVKT